MEIIKAAFGLLIKADWRGFLAFLRGMAVAGAVAYQRWLWEEKRKVEGERDELERALSDVNRIGDVGEFERLRKRIREHQQGKIVKL